MKSSGNIIYEALVEFKIPSFFLVGLLRREQVKNQLSHVECVKF